MDLRERSVRDFFRNSDPSAPGGQQSDNGRRKAEEGKQLEDCRYRRSLRRDFLRDLPTTWEETRFIEGYPGKYVVLARKAAATGQWYIAGLNALKEPLTLTLDISSFGTLSKLYIDNKASEPTLSPVKPDKKGRLKLTLQPNGGFIIK